ncbi:hypothetical protein Dester_0976 [Desulfurobacterium thermolithotrophum DSM 11699]|uniref:Uncharacterized protein n=1 Tax=Desulfurobacterium thermolithotrophum (strain DSM 11699 / BSA) TaxID=868864 RepID=F0S443_DESTD|nr:hypothetical protein [Desulfurobacterium thermolithotrophum]ADY73615.1 hypothetical protein Dester_0976 [Desulfurobacterium thermolithotrophum DSM 11699]
MEELQANKRVKAILRAYQVYFRKLAFERLPTLAEEYFGSAGFRIVSDALADATAAAVPGLLEAVEGIAEIPDGDLLKVLELHYIVHSAAREITRDETIGLFVPNRVSEKRLEMVAKKCPHDADGIKLAVFVGVVAGVIKALGGKANGITDEKFMEYLPKGSYAVWAIKEDESCKLIVEEVV